MKDYAPAGDSGLLSLGQKRNLVRLARRAWEKSGKGKVEGGVGFDGWRNAVAIRACGLRIREARQRDWGALRAAFLDAAGDVEGAFAAAMRDEDNPRRVALFKLGKECAAVGLSLAYPEAICRRQNKVSLHEATAAQVWRLIFTVRNRRKKGTQGTKGTKGGGRNNDYK